MSRARGPRCLSAAFALAAACAGCGDETGPAAESAKPLCGTSAPHIAEGIVLTDACGNAVELLPVVRIEGAWRGGGDDGPCTAEGTTVRCPAGSAGDVAATALGHVASVRFEAAADTLVEAIALRGTASVAGATAWLSDGFQSWSQSGVVALGHPASDEALAEALAARGDGEVMRGGSELSWTMTFVGGPLAGGDAGPSLVAGALSASTWKPWVRASLAEDGGVDLLVASGGTGESVAVPAASAVDGEAFFVALGDDLEGMLDAYGRAIPSRRWQSPRVAQAGWNSWYELWDAVDEQAVRDNAALLPEVLGLHLPAGAVPRIVVDDGWQVAWGEWVPNEKFPSGLDGLAADLAADGASFGVWLAPLLADADGKVATEHPEWFVDGATYDHPKHGAMRVLDPTHPEAAAHLADTIATLVGWGIGLLKIDFLFAGTFEGGRAQTVTGMQAYARALEIIREAAGPDTLLVAVGAPAVASFPYVDGWRVGADIAFETSGARWPFLPNQARSVASRWPYCLATLCDADPVIQRDLEPEEVETGGWVVAFAGGAWFLSDDLRVLPEQRRGFGLDARRGALALGGAPSVPEDPFPAEPPETLANTLVDIVSGRTTQVVPRIFRDPTGARVAVNVGDEEVSILGTDVPPHATRALP